MKIRTSLLALALLLSPAAQAIDFRSEVGAGIQYGGFIGYQASLHTHGNSFNYSLGALGSSLGYEFAATNQFTIGIQALAVHAGGLGLAVGRSLHVNYHLSSVASSGWIVGLDLYDVGTSVDYEEVANNEVAVDSVDRGAFISVGYRFF